MMQDGDSKDKNVSNPLICFSFCSPGTELALHGFFGCRLQCPRVPRANRASTAAGDTEVSLLVPRIMLALYTYHSFSLRSYRSRQSSHDFDGDDRLLLKSSPLVHPEYTATEDYRSFVKGVQNIRLRLRGWRLGVLLASTVTSIVLLTNCTAAVVIHFTYGTYDGVSTAFVGDCDIANRWSLGLHIVINILSSALLGASNYTMQVLNAPTRSECDIAHARGDWVDIGVTSLRNIAKITWPRRVLWLLLGLSSVPIHLLYNSATFKTIDSNSYVVVIATPFYLQSDAVPPPKWQESAPEWLEYGEIQDYDTETLRLSYQSRKPDLVKFRQSYQLRKLEFVNLTTAECINTYAVDFVTGHSDVIAVLSEPYPVNATVGVVTVSWPKVDYFASLSYNW
jgi:hypothetical protein